MRIVLIAVPYDAGRQGVGVGAGPARLIDAGLATDLRALGHDVRESSIALPVNTSSHELARIVAVQRALADEVRDALSRDETPIVLAGNCSTAVGVLAARPPGTAVVWFDAHGDFHTAETTSSGMVDGMALRMVTGGAMRNLTSSVRGFIPVEEHRVILVGARDLDPPEESALAESRVTRVSATEAPATVRSALHALGKPAPSVYVHLDLDVLDPRQARANQYEAPDGLSPGGLAHILREVVSIAPLYAVAITAYDPSWDSNGATRRAAVDAVRAMLPQTERDE